MTDTGLSAQAGGAPYAMACSRVPLSRSPRWCRAHLAKLALRLAPSGLCLLLFVLANVYRESTWLRGLPVLSFALFALFGLLLVEGVRSFELLLDLPPLQWRRRARRADALKGRVWADIDDPARRGMGLVCLFPCPGCNVDAAWPTDRIRYRCRDVEFEVRGDDVWIASAASADEPLGRRKDPCLGQGRVIH